MSVSTWRRLLVLGLLWLPTLVWAQNLDNPLKGQRVLVFSKTVKFRHSSIPQGIRCVEALGRKHGFTVDATENSTAFTEDNLKKYKVVVFLSTTGDVLNDSQQAAFERYIQAGGGYVGIHAAADTEYDWPWYGKMVGGWFLSHPGNPNVRTGDMTVRDKNHPATAELPTTFKRTDEFYDYKNVNPDIKVLITVDEKSYGDAKMNAGENHPMAWYHEYDGGRIFYTAYGHTDETFMEPLFLQHLWGGLRWAGAGMPVDYKKAKTQRAPEENRFSREVLDEKLYEPTELAVRDGKVFFTHRRGEIRYYNPKNSPKVKTLDTVSVFSTFEYGLMGLNLDPKFEENHWMYMYYSPSASHYGADTANRLVRVKFNPTQETIDWKTEQVLLRVPVKRSGCCHTGGSIEFDKVGNLYLSTGDDTNPFDSDGFSPSDERPDRRGWDARATSSNTNDYRGKILRIKPNDDGTAGYSIPAGNLFKPGTDKALPEIYVMGNRNPYRISVDKHTGYLYWGEVGPDAANNIEGRGPRGHDEVNQARQAGYFGWPLFVADNRAYNRYNFEKKQSGEKYDPAKPINDSPHNTGLKELPPAQKPIIYYPYADSPEFGEIVGKGGRNAMAGPVFYAEDYDANSKVRFPDFYQGKFFAYDWVRDYINVVTLKPNGDLQSMERFLPDWKFSHPIDMQFDRDGSLYMLEYGPNWFAQNDDARLTRITYNAGNRPPVAVASASKTAGAAPLQVTLSSKGSMDYDGDALRYEWTVNGKKFTTPTASYTFAKPGIYKPVLKVTDAAGKVSQKTLEIQVGNELPKVEVAVKGNQTFYFDQQPVVYEVKVSDKEDGSLANKKIAAEDVNVDINFLEGYDKTVIAQGHQMNTSFSTGKRLMELSDCKACHAIDKKSIGPAYRDVAKKYKGKNAEAKLVAKVINGGAGVWGEQPMSAHPQLSKADVSEMVKYILSLTDDKKKSQPLKGNYTPEDNGKNGTYIFAASYTDKGNGSIAPQTAQQAVTLRSAKVPALSNDVSKYIQTSKSKELKKDLAVATTSGSYLGFRKIDLSEITSVVFNAYTAPGKASGGQVEIRLGSPTGKLIGQTSIRETGQIQALLTGVPTTGLTDVYFVFLNPDAKDDQDLFALDTIEFQKKRTEHSSMGK
ncbi:HHIP-like protein 1 [Siphonobacter sp. BAB-5385]|uniref:ThuA domain-containing protein n=1 Tax=Siphonobacter sp. BAB-5385 TaxID=1864822 RepID=UPI000B9E1E53|nr:ThuA domain-containing protein [Siphonobacter sp. BAB-5385]OZI05951.1 HHIP-like protein 1 [Siphonobacter sp. BAB-5385]